MPEPTGIMQDSLHNDSIAETILPWAPYPEPQIRAMVQARLLGNSTGDPVRDVVIDIAIETICDYLATKNPAGA